jgi:tetratricopeptide (TPR) repeat protein
MKKFSLPFFACLLLSSLSQAECPAKTAAQWVYELKAFDLAAHRAGDDHDSKADAATKGLEAAGCCLALKASDPACVFYRGVHRGWLLDARIKDVKAGLAAMKADFEEAERLNPKLEGGAPSRALGNLYLSLPVIPIFGREFSRDLDKAQAYAQKAVAIAPNDPENLQLLGELALKNGDKAAAVKFFTQGLAALNVPKNLSPMQQLIDADLSKLLKKAQ